MQIRPTIQDKMMSHTFRSLALAATLMAGFAPMVIGHAEAKTTMAECSVKFKAAKANGDTMKWNDFRKAQCSDGADTAAAPEEPAAKPAKAKKTKKPATAAAAPAEPAGQTFAQKCSADWAALKASNQVPAGMTWNDFRKAKCVVSGAPAAAEPANTKTKAKPAAKTTTAAAPADAGGQTFIQKCSTDWAALKAADQVPAGMTWNDFRKAKCVVSGAPAAQSASTKPAAAKPVAKTTTAAAPAAGSGTFMQRCSADWSALKAANQVPDGMTWRDFVSAKCVVDASATPAATDENALPMEPTQAVNLDNIDVATVSKSGKPFTPGQIAAHKRQKACGMKWREEKANNTLQVGMKWPQYWSQCNTAMKAALTN
jgi:hypothetical protein